MPSTDSQRRRLSIVNNQEQRLAKRFRESWLLTTGRIVPSSPAVGAFVADGLCRRAPDDRQRMSFGNQRISGGQAMAISSGMSWITMKGVTPR